MAGRPRQTPGDTCDGEGTTKHSPAEVAGPNAPLRRSARIANRNRLSPPAESHVLQEDHRDAEDDEEEEATTQERTFTLFPKLPIELRLRIWKFSFPPTKVLEIASGKAIPQNGPFSLSNPVALFINRESRSETLRYYRLLFSSSNSTSIYFNPSADIIRTRVNGGVPFWGASPVKWFTSNGGIVDDIKHVTLYNIIWSRTIGDLFLASKDVDMSFHYFKALKTLNLVFYFLYGSEAAQECKEVVEQYLQKYKKATPEYRVPEVLCYFPPLKGKGELW